jgi:prephenate dehydratase
MLEQLAVRGVNLSRIESRPIGDELGRYSFSMDAEGHIAEERVGEALMGLHRVCPHVRFLGSYPRADGVPADVRTGTADGDFRDARGWLATLRRGEVV